MFRGMLKAWVSCVEFCGQRIEEETKKGGVKKYCGEFLIFIIVMANFFLCLLCGLAPSFLISYGICYLFKLSEICMLIIGFAMFIMIGIPIILSCESSIEKLTREYYNE